jgi:hypothetical protein
LWGILAILLLCVTITAPAVAQAEPPAALSSSHWVVVTGSEASEGSPEEFYDGLYTIDTDTNTVYGPFLTNELTYFDEGGYPHGGDTFDLVVTPDGKTALISSFGYAKIHFVDLTDPQNPAYITSLTLAFFAEDIALTADGRYALVADGGFSTYVAVIDIASQTQIGLLDMTNIFIDGETGDPYSGYANGVTVAPDGTVLMPDYFSGALYTATLAEDGTLTYNATYKYYVATDGTVTTDPDADPETTYSYFRPVNVTVAPDGVTVLVSDCNNYAYDVEADQYTNQFTVGVYLITAPGVLEFQGAITGLTHALQSIAFGWNSSLGAGLGNGAGAYDIATGFSYENDRLFTVKVLSPGVVEIDPLRSVELLRSTSGQLFGVDGLVVYHGNAYATYPNRSIDSDLYPERYVSILDLNSLDLTQIDWGPSETHSPIGIAGILHINQLFLPTVLR